MFESVLGQSAIRPAAGPAVAASTARSGLSQVKVAMLLRKNDPSYASFAKARSLAHSRLDPSSVVR